MSDSATYKQQKEDFVSNLSGGSVAEVNVISAVIIVRPPPMLFLFFAACFISSHVISFHFISLFVFLLVGHFSLKRRD